MYNFRNKFKRNFAKWCTFSEEYVNWHLAERTGITPTCSAVACHGIPNKPVERTWKPYSVGDSMLMRYLGEAILEKTCGENLDMCRFGNTAHVSSPGGTAIVVNAGFSVGDT